MDREFFNKQIYRLRERFDTKYKEAYTLDMLNVLFAKLRNVENKDFEIAISRLLVSAKFKPLYNDFLEVLQPALNTSHTNKINELNAKLETCPRCSNMGVVFKIKKDKCPINETEQKYNYAYKCTACPRGELIHNGLPKDQRF
jgi:hypothetical protein